MLAVGSFWGYPMTPWTNMFTLMSQNIPRAWRCRRVGRRRNRRGGPPRPREIQVVTDTTPRTRRAARRRWSATSANSPPSGRTLTTVNRRARPITAQQALSRRSRMGEYPRNGLRGRRPAERPRSRRAATGVSDPTSYPEAEVTAFLESVEECVVAEMNATSTSRSGTSITMQSGVGRQKCSNSTDSALFALSAR